MCSTTQRTRRRGRPGLPRSRKRADTGGCATVCAGASASASATPPIPAARRPPCPGRLCARTRAVRAAEWGAGVVSADEQEMARVPDMFARGAVRLWERPTSSPGGAPLTTPGDPGACLSVGIARNALRHRQVAVRTSRSGEAYHEALSSIARSGLGRRRVLPLRNCAGRDVHMYEPVPGAPHDWHPSMSTRPRVTRCASPYQPFRPPLRASQTRRSHGHATSDHSKRAPEHHPAV